MISFSKYDERHVIEKVLQWRRLTKSENSTSLEDEDAAPVEESSVSDNIDDILWFSRRFARSNTRRREQLRYWKDHPYDSAAKQDRLDSIQTRPNSAKQLVKETDAKEESQSQTSTLKAPGFNVPVIGPKSAVSKQSFSTVAVSDVHDTGTNLRPRTVYTPTNIGQRHMASVPDPPKLEIGRTTFSCPYCGLTLESREMQNRQAWK